MSGYLRTPEKASSSTLQEHGGGLARGDVAPASLTTAQLFSIFTLPFS